MENESKKMNRRLQVLEARQSTNGAKSMLLQPIVRSTLDETKDNSLEVSTYAPPRGSRSLLPLIPMDQSRRSNSTTDPSISFKSTLVMPDQTKKMSNHLRRVKLRSFKGDSEPNKGYLVTSYNSLPINPIDHTHEQSLKADLLQDLNQDESVEKMISKEKKNINRKNMQLLKNVAEQIQEVESPSESSPAQFFQSTTLLQTDSIKKSVHMLRNPSNSNPSNHSRLPSPMKRSHISPSKSPPKSMLSKPQSPVKRRESRKFFEVAMTPKVEKIKFGTEQVRRISQDDFYKCLKDFENCQMFQEFYDQRDNIYMKIIKQSLYQDQMPKAYPFIQRNSIDVKTMDVSGGGLKALKCAIETLQTPQCKKVTSIDLSQNKIGVKLLQRFLDTLPKPLYHLNLSNSYIDLSSIDILIQYLPNLNELKTLNLEGNKFGDTGCTKVFNCIPDNHPIQMINMSINNLSSFCCEPISNFIKRNQSIRELYLHFNNINQIGGTYIFKSILKSKSLKVLDLSYNSMGNQGNFYQLTHKNILSLVDKRQFIEQSECIQAIVKFLSKPTEMVHLDLSYNKFNLNETQDIQKALSTNQLIYGFHFEGNCPGFVIDNCGFLQKTKYIQQSQLERAKPNAQRYESLSLAHEQEDMHRRRNTLIRPHKIQKEEQYSNQLGIQRRIQGVSRIKENQQYKSIVMMDTCWICEGWQELKLEWRPKRSGRICEMPVFVHINIFNYSPQLLTQIGEEFFTYVMVPPDALIQYFFTNPVLGIQTVARDQLIMDIPQNHDLQNPQVLIYNGDIIVDGPPQKQVNYIYTGDNNRIFDDQFTIKIFSKPRDEVKVFDFSAYMGDVQKGWLLERSFFSNYRIDNETHIRACFEFDFESSKISKMAKDEIESVKDTLAEFYPYIFNAYKYFCSFGSIHNLPCISLSTFYDLISSTKIMDGRIRSTDIDVLFVSSNGKDMNYIQVFEKAIVRYQLMELLVRIALDKYFKSGLAKTICQALIKLFDEDGLLDKLREFDSPQEWRDSRCWNEELDNLIQASGPFLRTLFKYCCQLNPKTRYYKYLWASAQDFKDLINILGVTGEHLNDREIYYIFLQSMMTQIDELSLPRHYQMNYYEFVEAMIRLAEKLSLILPTNGQKTDQIIYLPYQEKINYDLFRKTKAFFMYCYFRLVQPLKDTFRTQTDDDYFRIDQCMMSEKEYRQYQQSQFQGLQGKTSIKETRDMSSSSSSGSEGCSSEEDCSDSESEKSVELNVKEFILLTQVKDYQKKKTNAYRTQAKPSAQKNDNLFQLQSFVKYFHSIGR